MEIGIYEQIINQMFKCKLDSLDQEKYYIGRKLINKEKAVHYLSQYLLNIIQLALHAFDSKDNSVDMSIKLVNAIIHMIVREFNDREFENNLIDTGNSILTAIINKTTCEYPDIENYIKDITPITTLTQSSLFTGKNQAVNMRSELIKEIQCSDEICFLVSFIRLSGLNLIKRDLKKFVSSGKKLRIITTTYTQATEFRAIKELASWPNTEIKISYNIENDRLHAKAYLFRRNTGFHTAYIGSSNLSSAALTQGLEWNLKVTQVQLPQIISTIRNTFNTYWEDEEFETFKDGIDDQKLKDALSLSDHGLPIQFNALNLINPFDYQKEILDRLAVERELHGCYKNLIVAATGTGKTVIAAYDYRRFKETHQKANLLFVVHREEIIKHACSTFRNILQDENFGEMWYGGCNPTKISHLFASKDMLSSRLDSIGLPDDYYDYIIIDEVHHVTASSYRPFLKKFKPKILLGLTATPERMDGEDITQDFDNKISAEIRLPEALNTGLLSPFHYFGITDSVDLTEVRWDKGRFVASELSKIYTYNDRRTGVILRAVE